MSALFSPYTLKNVTLRNRIGVSPMCQYSSTDGMADDWHLVHLGARAVGGAGLIIAEATAVGPSGRISLHDAGLWTDKHVPTLKRINHFIKHHGAVAGVQLAHAGRKASVARPWEGGRSLTMAEGGWETLGPSAEAYGGPITQVPHAMTVHEINGVKGAFRAATQRAIEADYQWLEIHAAHGYLLHSFYSPLSNHRTDDYGGSFDNRIRFLLETVETVRAVWPDHLPLGVRISATDWVAGGWTIEDSVALAKRLKAAGVDIIDCSSGFAVADTSTYPFGPGFQVPLAEQVRREAAIPTMAVGQITEAAQAEAIIQSGQADIVLLARAMLRDPQWPFHAAEQLGVAAKALLPVQYQRV